MEGMVRPCKTVTSRKPGRKDWKSTDNAAHTSLCDSPVIYRGSHCPSEPQCPLSKMEINKSFLKELLSKSEISVR